MRIRFALLPVVVGAALSAAMVVQPFPAFAAESKPTDADNGDYSRGVTAFQAKDYEEAARLLRTPADQGVADAQIKMGWMYERGLGVDKDYAQAMAWYRKLADKGDAAAEDNIAFMYEFGEGVAKDIDQARAWAEKGAEKGFPHAQRHLGELYMPIRGWVPNIELAMKWLGMAADRGDAIAAADIGELYTDGAGIPIDYQKAMIWYRKAADQGDASAQNRVGELFRDGEGVRRDYKQAALWFEKAATQGEPLAQTNLGDLYTDGDGVTRDYFKAAFWYRKAADQGWALGEGDLGTAYLVGRGVRQDAALAASWLRKAAEQGNDIAEQRLGAMYVDGVGVPEDYSEALKWLHKAAAEGNDQACTNLGDMYAKGLGVPRDYKIAGYWYAKAAERDNPQGEFELAQLYEHGTGVDRDLEQARTWYVKSAEDGWEQAKKWVALHAKGEPKRATASAASGSGPSTDRITAAANGSSSLAASLVHLAGEAHATATSAHTIESRKAAGTALTKRLADEVMRLPIKPGAKADPGVAPLLVELINQDRYGVAGHLAQGKLRAMRAAHVSFQNWDGKSGVGGGKATKDAVASMHAAALNSSADVPQMFVAFSFSKPSMLSDPDFGGDGGWGVGLNKFEQAARDASSDACAAHSTKPEWCGIANGGSYEVCNQHVGIRWAALAIRNDGSLENWSDGEALGFDDQAHADQSALSNCGGDACNVVWSQPVQCGAAQVQAKPAVDVSNCLLTDSVRNRSQYGSDAGQIVWRNHCNVPVSVFVASSTCAYRCSLHFAADVGPGATITTTDSQVGVCPIGRRSFGDDCH